MAELDAEMMSSRGAALATAVDAALAEKADQTALDAVAAVADAAVTQGELTTALADKLDADAEAIAAAGGLTQEVAARNARQGRRYSVIGNNSNNFGGSAKTVTTALTYDTVRSLHVNKTGKVVTNIVLVYANWGVASSTEAANANQVIVQATREPNGTASDQSGPRQPIYFNGLDKLTLDRRAIGFSDPTPSWILPDGNIYLRQAYTSPVDGGSVQRGICTRGTTNTFGTGTGEGADSGSNRVADGSPDVTASNQTAIYSTVAILGTLQDGSIAASAYIAADSIAGKGIDDAGYGYNQGGWLLRALDDFPVINGGIAGEKLADWVDLKKSYTRFQEACLATTCINAYGHNDLAQGRTVAQLKADTLADALRFMSRGMRFVKTTILPAPTSINGCYDAAGQTPWDKDPERIEFNTWLRDLGVSGFISQANAQVTGILYAGDAKILDGCAGIEVNSSNVLTMNGGRVLANQPGGKLATGTATSGTTTSLTLTGAGWTANAFKGKSLYIASGTGAGQSRCIGYNSATVLTTLNAFDTAPDSTSVFEVFESGMTGVHPQTALSIAAAASVNVAAVVI